MAVSLVGEIVNSCDAITGFNVGNISGDDDFVEGTGAIGLKISGVYSEIYTTTLGATAPYDFSVGGGEDGYHYILWFNTKLALPATGGFRCIVGNGTDRAEWNVDPIGFYKGGFITKVIDPTRDFDAINAGTWTLSGNPAQLSNITIMGGGIESVPTIMGNFNSGQLDQMTIGLGVRVDAGSTGTPNTFETVRAADEDTAFYGWWSSSNGAVIGKGKLYIGPSTGSVTSVFKDSAFVVIFAEELVSTNFYEINTRGAGTDVSWDLASISSANPSTVRWGLTVDPTTNTFYDTNGVWTGANDISLQSSAGFTGTTFIDCNKIIQSGATLDGITVLAANTADGVAFIESNNPSNIKNSSFTFSDGHAIEITTSGTYTFDGNSFIGYGVSGSTDAAIYNNSSGLVTLNLLNVNGVPTIRNGAGSTTVAEITTSVKVTALDAANSNPVVGSRVLLLAGSGGDLTEGSVILDDITNGSGVLEDTGFNYTNPQPVTGRIRKGTNTPLYKQSPITGTIQATGLDLTVFLVSDE
jgi:hypothetical protein